MWLTDWEHPNSLNIHILLGSPSWVFVVLVKHNTLKKQLQTSQVQKSEQASQMYFQAVH